jgi:multiple sugar transport system permease protein
MDMIRVFVVDDERLVRRGIIFEVQKLFPAYYFNSLYIALLVVIGTCIVAAISGYAYAKINFPLKNTLFIVMLSSMMIPVEVTAIPMFVWVSALNLNDTHLPLIIPPILGAQVVFGIMLMRQYYITIPYDLDEAAKIDGCTPWTTFTRIMLPMSVAPMATLSILTFIGRWNELLEPLIYLSKQKLYTLPLGIALFADQSGIQWHLVMAASVLVTVPLLVVFFFMQKQFIESLALTGIK